MVDYADSSYAGEIDDQKSITRYGLFFIERLPLGIAKDNKPF